MVGLDRILSRLEELGRVLTIGCEWMLFLEPEPLADLPLPADDGCISCHFGYFWIASRIADRIGCDAIACGYVGYQDHWVEQTPYAIEQLRHVLGQRKQRLLLPVGDIQSREDAETELRAQGLSTNSLELKCLKQRGDPHLTGFPLKTVVDTWIDNLKTDLVSSRSLGDPANHTLVSREGAA